MARSISLLFINKRKSSSYTNRNKLLIQKLPVTHSGCVKSTMCRMYKRSCKTFYAGLHQAGTLSIWLWCMLRNIN